MFSPSKADHFVKHDKSSGQGKDVLYVTHTVREVQRWFREESHFMLTWGVCTNKPSPPDVSSTADILPSSQWWIRLLKLPLCWRAFVYLSNAFPHQLYRVANSDNSCLGGRTAKAQTVNQILSAGQWKLQSARSLMWFFNVYYSSSKTSAWQTKLKVELYFCIILLVPLKPSWVTQEILTTRRSNADCSAVIGRLRLFGLSCIPLPLKHHF